MNTLKVNKVVLVDDHTLFRKGMVELINKFNNFKVIWDASNGKELQKQLKTQETPDIILLDIAMPEMDGFETAQFLKEKYPEIKFIALSMCDNESAIIKMIKYGSKGYILKDTNPEYLENALNDVVKKGFFYSEWLSGTLLNSILGIDSKNEEKELSGKELEFLKYACTELTYKEIADKMFLSVRTIDGYREALFEKLNVKSRVGLVIYAIKQGIFNV